MGHIMDEDLKQLFITRFDRLESKLDAMANEQNRTITNIAVMNRDIEATTDDIKELKNSILPNEIKAGIQKTKIWIYSSICGVLVSIVLSLLFKFVI
jgi:hypothetical protein